MTQEELLESPRAFWNFNAVTRASELPSASHAFIGFSSSVGRDFCCAMRYAAICIKEEQTKFLRNVNQVLVWNDVYVLGQFNKWERVGLTIRWILIGHFLSPQPVLSYSTEFETISITSQTSFDPDGALPCRCDLAPSKPFCLSATNQTGITRLQAFHQSSTTFSTTNSSLRLPLYRLDLREPPETPWHRFIEMNVHRVTFRVLIPGKSVPDNLVQIPCHLTRLRPIGVRSGMSWLIAQFKGNPVK